MHLNRIATLDRPSSRRSSSRTGTRRTATGRANLALLGSQVSQYDPLGLFLAECLEEARRRVAAK